MTKTKEAITRKCAQYLTPSKVVSLGPGLPSNIPFALKNPHSFVFMSTTGLLGSWSLSYEATAYVDSNNNYVKLNTGSTVTGIGDRGAIISGGYADTFVVEPDDIDDIGSWTIKGRGTEDVESLINNCRQVIGLVEIGARNLEPCFENSIVDNKVRFSRLDKIITEMCVISLFNGKFILEEIKEGCEIDEITSGLGIEVEISSGCKYYDPNNILENVWAEETKIFKSGDLAVSDIPDGATVMIDGFAGPGGMAHHLLVSLRDQGAKNLTIISNTAGIARVVNFGTPPGKLVIDHSILIDNGQVSKAIASYPVSPSASNPSSFELAYRAGEVDLELVPQGTLAERLRAGGAGVKNFYTPTGAGTLIAKGKENVTFGTKEFIQESGLIADYCIIRGYKADRFGNVVYKGTSRNFNAVMAPAAKISIVEVDEIVEDGEFDPELIVTPGLFVDRIVVRPEDFSPYE